MIASGAGSCVIGVVVTTGCDFKAVMVTPLEVGAEAGADENVVVDDVGGGGWCG